MPRLPAISLLTKQCAVQGGAGSGSWWHEDTWPACPPWPAWPTWLGGFSILAMVMGLLVNAG